MMYLYTVYEFFKNVYICIYTNVYDYFIYCIYSVYINAIYTLFVYHIYIYTPKYFLNKSGSFGSFNMYAWSK